MASSYSTQLRIELMATGEKDATWGTINNTSLQLLEAAIAGRAAVTHDDTANYTLTTANGAADEARRMIIDIGGALTAARNAVVPTQTKFYVVKNSTTGGYAVTVKTSGGTGIAVPNGKTMLLFCDGTNVVEAINQIVGDFGVTGTISMDATVAAEFSSRSALRITERTVVTSATSIFNISTSGVAASGAFVTVSGYETAATTKTFTDIVLCIAGGGTPTTISAQDLNGPQTRTYSMSGSNLQLAMGASTSYTVSVTGLIQSN